MFRSRILIASFELFALAAPAFAKPASPSLKQQLQAVYKRMSQADMNRNLDGFMAFYDPSYIGVDTDKKTTNWDQMRQTLQFAYTEQTNIHITTSIQKVQPWKKGVVVLVQAVEVWDTDAGYLHMKVVETDEDYWVKSDGAWKLKQEDVLSSFTWHNGQPYNQ